MPNTIISGGAKMVWTTKNGSECDDTTWPRRPLDEFVIPLSD
jgi:hypothetical protein